MHITIKTETSHTLLSRNNFSPEHEHLAHLLGLQFTPSLLHYTPDGVVYCPPAFQLEIHSDDSLQ